MDTDRAAPSKPSPSDWLRGDSAMASMIRGFDWTATPLGPIESWPAALRVAVNICLGSRFPMYVWWGPDLINIYNDAYAPMLGRRHPEALGRPAGEVWVELWPILGPQIDAVLKRGESSWHERTLLPVERNGFQEEAWFTFSQSPIHDEAGKIAGLFCAVTEETQRVQTEAERDRLLKNLDVQRSQLTIAFKQSPAFMCILRGPQHIFEFFNDQYARLIGHRDALGKPLGVALPEVVEQGFLELLDRVYSTGVSFVGTDLPVRLQREPGKPMEVRYVEFVYQPMRDGDGVISGILVHGVDTTDRKRAKVRDELLLSIDEAARSLSDPAQITAACARLLGEHIDADRCAYADVEEDQDTFNLTGDYNRGVPSIVGRYRFSDFGSEVLQLMRADLPFVVNDVDTHQPSLGDLTYYRQTMIRAVICMPLHKAGRFVAAIAVHQKSPRKWSPEEVSLVRHVANRCWESIERARVERTLRASEERFRAAFEQAAVGIALVGLDGRWIRVNRKLCDLLGYRHEELMGLTFQQITHPDDVDNNLVLLQQLLAGEIQSYSIQKRYIRKDGQIVWAALTAALVGEGPERYFVSVVEDITPRKQAEEALRQSEAHYAASVRTALDCVISMDHEGRVVEWNPSAEITFGFKREEVIGREMAGLIISPGYREAHRQGLLRYLRTEEAVVLGKRLELSAVRRDGTEFPVELAITRLPTAGQPLFTAYLRDISQRKAAEMELRHSQQVAEQSYAQLQAVLGNMTEGLVVAAPDGAMLQWNKSALKLHGFDNMEAVHRNLSSFPETFELSTADGRVLPLEQWPMSRVLRGERFASWEIRVQRRDTGLSLMISYSGAPLLDREGRVVLGILTEHDITRRKAADLERERLLASEREARSEAERASLMKDEFLATLSHELRTPLNAILGWSQILLGSSRSGEDLITGLRTIERNARAQTQIIEDLLDMSRIISGKVRLDLQAVDLTLLVKSAVETARPSAEAKGVRLQTLLDPFLTQIRGDAGRLQQVLWNLISNAIKFTPRGGSVQVRLQRIDSQIELTVVDSGEGIAPDFLPYVFDRFRQADATTTRRHGGLGLGLAIVKQLVELHGGAIRAESAGLGAGASFTVSLPQVEIWSGADLRADAGFPSRLPELQPNLANLSELHQRVSGLRILIVDDEPDVRDMLRQLMEACGATVMAVASAAEAMPCLRNGRPDVMVCDIGMPDEDGYSFIRRVRTLSLREGGAIPAVALTAYARAEDRIKAIQAGFQMHVAKPVEPAELIVLLASLAGRTESQ